MGGKNGSQVLDFTVGSNLLQDDRKGGAGVLLLPSRDSATWGESGLLTTGWGELGNRCSP